MPSQVIVRENNRHGSKRDPVASTISTPDHAAPLESRRQRRALRGPKTFRTAITSTVRDAQADPVQTFTRKRKPRTTRVYNPTHRDAPGRFTRDPQAGQQYVHGTG